MCGICGYTGAKQAAPVLWRMLKTMEAHDLGYESTGMATMENSKLVLIKNVGKTDAVFPENGAWRSLLRGTVGIAHTRYPSPDAPVGEQRYAHPFISCDSKTTLIHNGTITNHNELRHGLAGHCFTSLDEATGKINDSEVILHLLEEKLSAHEKSEKSIIAAASTVCKLLAENKTNIYLFAFINATSPETVFVVSGNDHEDKRKVVVAYKRGFGSLFASYREEGIRFKAIADFVDPEKGGAEVLSYGCLAVLRKDSYEVVRLDT